MKWREQVKAEVFEILVNSDLPGDLNTVSAKIADAIFTGACGKFAIEHAGILVVPADHDEGPFDTHDEARRWAEWNYKGQTNWRVVRMPATVRP